MKKIILASQSPRRSDILKKENYFFVSFPVYVSEIPDKNLSLNDQIIDIARRKARACLDQYPAKNEDAIILAADTMVCLGQETLGKPLNDLDAFETLKKLSGRIHQVKTAIFLIDLKTFREVSHLESSDVQFKKLSNEDIYTYISKNEHHDKAGSYAIQGHGKVLVEKFSGDYENIIGLPISVLKEIFIQNDWSIQSV